ncbi:MAG: class I SAM-dependent methyltransferase [Candidatus Omnitrophota bacterium]|nr:class I SAM-dependent methyltransferase [Candidatus Omnitrophota bacterium]
MAEVFPQKTVAQFAERACIHPKRGPFLFRLVRELQPMTILELGTGFGISTLYIAAASKLNGTGNITTLEGASQPVRIARSNFEKAGLGGNITSIHGFFQDTLDGILATLGEVDFVFIDGHHEEEPTLSYVHKILPRLSACGMIVLDDIDWSEGMMKAWRVLSGLPFIESATAYQWIGLLTPIPCKN